LSRGDRSRPGRERTAEERERDREERARRRAPAPEQPPEVSPPDPGVPPVQPPPPSQPPPATQPPPLPVQPPSPVERPPPLEPPSAVQTPLPPPGAPLPAPEQSATFPRAKRRRSVLARLAAVFALAAVVAAVVLLLHSLESKRVAPPAPPPVVKVLIAEGKTRVQIAQIVAADGLKGSYRAASRKSPLLDPAVYGAPRGTPDLEGFLFPATYDMNPGAPVNRLVEEQLIAFRENFGASVFSRARALHVTPYQLLIVASMVEREARAPGDRPKIAAVIYNRLARGMPLGIDASIYYAVELGDGIATYTHELTEAQLHIDSPYNTRTHVGLPPTPISNPGTASMQAAAHPAHVPYLYYVAGADGCGEQVFSTTFAQFERDAAAYDAAVKRNGGKPPVCKKK
jgi:cell division protein YceG involved in septum cleavage